MDNWVHSSDFFLMYKSGFSAENGSFWLKFLTSQKDIIFENYHIEIWSLKTNFWINSTQFNCQNWLFSRLKILGFDSSFLVLIGLETFPILQMQPGGEDIIFRTRIWVKRTQILNQSSANQVYPIDCLIMAKNK